jgi:hypothetical protein
LTDARDASTVTAAVNRSVVELAAIAAQPEQPERALFAIVELRQRLDELEGFQVGNARDHGRSWSEIARPLRVTRQAVHRKYAQRLEDGRRPAAVEEGSGVAGTSAPGPNLGV